MALLAEGSRGLCQCHLPDGPCRACPVQRAPAVVSVQGGSGHARGDLALHHGGLSPELASSAGAGEKGFMLSPVTGTGLLGDSGQVQACLCATAQPGVTWCSRHRSFPSAERSWDSADMCWSRFLRWRMLQGRVLMEDATGKSPDKKS